MVNHLPVFYPAGMKKFRFVFALFILGLLFRGSVFGAVDNALVSEGKRLFRNQCARCHGIDGAGGEGANLKRKKLKHAADDEALAEIIANGIRGTGMPYGILSEGEVTRLTAYVRFLGQLPVELPPGDAKRGADIFANRGACLGCHIVAGQGRAIGPELTSIGDQRGLHYLRESLMSPAETMPTGTAPLSGTYQGYLSVRLRAKDGQSVQGVRINEDAFSIQVRDLGGRLLSFDKKDLVDYEKLFGHSFMPGADMSEKEINDLVSYLMSLRESP